MPSRIRLVDGTTLTVDLTVSELKDLVEHQSLGTVGVRTVEAGHRWLRVAEIAEIDPSRPKDQIAPGNSDA